MAHLYKALEAKSEYVDRQFPGTPDEYRAALARSSTVYVGNLSYYTTEEQIWELFTKAGEVKRIIMGLNREKLTPCGFCFVEYFDRKDALDCVNWISGTKLDDRVIRTDIDFGFFEVKMLGRQFGRGRSGAQIRDDFRNTFDSGRGGYGLRKELEDNLAKNRERYRGTKRRRSDDEIDDRERRRGDSDDDEPANKRRRSDAI